MQVVKNIWRIIMNTSDKRTLKKYTSIMLVCLMLACSFFLAACAKEEPLSIHSSENNIVISVTEEDLSNEGEVKLLDYMNELKNRKELDFTIDDGMVTSINGIKNTDKYWMLHTSDVENSNFSWGTVEYDGKKYGSAVCGAKDLTLKPNHYYIWVYKAVS